MRIICGGMLRSGSTWMYNAIRLMMKDQEGLKVGFASDPDTIQSILSSPNAVLKSHAVDPVFYDKSDLILISHRSLRDATISYCRKTGESTSVSIADHIFDLYWKWVPFADYDMQYEHFLEDPLAELRQIASKIKFEGDLNEILNKLNQIKPSKSAIGTKDVQYDPVTLFWNNHIFDGRKDIWMESMAPEMSSKIVKRHKNWYTQYYGLCA